MMGPNTFVNINDGHRRRLAWFAEVASKWNSKWTTLLGIRNDTVWTNTGPVSGYSSDMMYAMDAAAFNSLSRARTDIDIDLTALARYEPNRLQHFRDWLRAQDPCPQPLRALRMVHQLDDQRDDQLVW